MERQLAARADRSAPRKDSVRARWRAHAATLTTPGLVFGSIGLLVFWIPLAWITADHLATPVILGARGVTVEAVVDYRSHGRVPSLDVRTVEAPQFSTTLYHWPRHLEVGDRFELTYDPRRPTRAAAEDTPWVDAQVVQFAIIDLVVLPCGLLLVPMALELARRARNRRATGLLLKSDDGSPRRPLGGLRRGYTAATQNLRDDADTQPPLVTFTVFLLLPGVLFVAGGGFVVVQAAQAAALYERGTSGTAVVDRTNMVSGWGEYADIHFDVRATPSTASPVRTTVTHLAAQHFEGESIEVVYDPAHPENAIEAGAIPWGWAEWTATAVFAASGAFGAVSVPAAVAPLRRTVRGERPGPAAQ